MNVNKGISGCQCVNKIFLGILNLFFLNTLQGNKDQFKVRVISLRIFINSEKLSIMRKNLQTLLFLFTEFSA